MYFVELQVSLAQGPESSDLLQLKLPLVNSPQPVINDLSPCCVLPMDLDLDEKLIEVPGLEFLRGLTMTAIVNLNLSPICGRICEAWHFPAQMSAVPNVPSSWLHFV